MFRLAALIVALAMPLSVRADVVILSDRTFWVGEDLDVPNEINSRIFLNGLKWAEPLLEIDQVLSKSLVLIYRRHYSIPEYVSTYDHEVLSDSQIPDWARHPGFEIRGIPNHPNHLLTYIATEPRGKFRAKCSRLRLDEQSRFSQCYLMASYGPDPHIALQARIFRPPNPADDTAFFNAVADRLVEIATCLDVTNYAAFEPIVQEGMWPCGINAVQR